MLLPTHARTAIFLAVVTLLTGCDAGGDDRAEVLVFGAASLTTVFAEIGTAFEEANPNIAIDLNFAGSSSLREQILAGAPADVFASANEDNMAHVVAGLAEPISPVVFARNDPVIAVPSGNPGNISGLGDLTDPDLLIGLCAVEVPCGEIAHTVLAKAGITPSIDTAEPNVRALLTKIEAGELDAGIVYRTDVVERSRADSIAIPEPFEVEAVYPIAALTDQAAASEFVGFVLSTDGQSILARHGFLGP